jgi:peptidoglycan DL-endopeptidase CwlO
VSTPTALVASLMAPIHDVAARVGPGWSAGPDPAVALAAARDDLDRLRQSVTATWQVVEAGWRGAAADAAREFQDTTVATISAATAGTDRIGAATTAAAEAVATARARLRALLDDFERRAAALDVDVPGAEQELVAEAERALAEAEEIVAQLEDELGTQAARLTADAEPVDTRPAAAAPTLPGWGGPPGGGASFGQSAGTGLGSGLASALGSSGGIGGLDGPNAMSDHDADVGSHHTTADPGMFGSGVSVTLPDGSTATAPNATAASAVRHALTQLGVPYRWGGTTPGVSLDCSGLTQWAYREAGLELPRLAQEQDIGAAVDRGSLRPGDLAVWDGHVALIVGNGQMIEAGDPVKLSPIRTTNAGQGFQGFWRPTA